MSVNVTTNTSMDKKGNTTIKKLRVEEMVDMKAKGLCFHCDEKLGMGHNCKKLFSSEALGHDEDNIEEDFLDIEEELET